MLEAILILPQLSFTGAFHELYEIFVCSSPDFNAVEVFLCVAIKKMDLGCMQSCAKRLDDKPHDMRNEGGLLAKLYSASFWRLSRNLIPCGKPVLSL